MKRPCLPEGVPAHSAALDLKGRRAFQFRLCLLPDMGARSVSCFIRCRKGGAAQVEIIHVQALEKVLRILRRPAPAPPNQFFLLSFHSTTLHRAHPFSLTRLLAVTVSPPSQHSPLHFYLTACTESRTEHGHSPDYFQRERGDGCRLDVRSARRFENAARR